MAMAKELVEIRAGLRRMQQQGGAVAAARKLPNGRDAPAQRAQDKVPLLLQLYYHLVAARVK
jgi:hypothetical protein